MEGIIVTQNNLPSNIEDLTKFVLIGREKLTAVRANIRAIDKLQLAEDVREQKKEEAQMLAEALLDAEVRIGDLLKQIPKASGGDRKSEEIKNRTVANFEKQETKQQIIEKLGFNKDQASRFEALSSNKDVVEQVKAEARENDDIPTRSRVLQLVKEKSKEQQEYEEYCKELDEAQSVFNKITDAIHKPIQIEITEESVKYFVEDMTIEDIVYEEENIDKAISNLYKLKEELQKYKGIREVK